MNIDAYWSKLGRRGQIALLSFFLPGVLLHELVHYWAFHGVSKEIWIDYDTVSCYAVIEDSAPKYRRIWGQIAPTVVGCFLLPIFVKSLVFGLSVPALVFLGVNFALFASPSPGDIHGAADALKS